MAYGLLIGLLVGTARHTSLIEPLVAAGPTLTVMLVVAAVLIPAYVRFGARKAAMVLLTSMVGGIGLAIFVRDLPGVRPFLEDAAAALAHVQPWMLALSPLVGIAALAASCLVSIRIYQRQDH